MALKCACLISLGCLIVLSSGCARRAEVQDTFVQMGGQRIELRGCEADTVNIWNNNAVIRTGSHVVRVDENYITVNGRVVTRPDFQTIVISCDGDDRIDVRVDGRTLEQLGARR